MSPEKDIVNVWLNKRGFFTVNDLNAGKNKVISILALKYNKDTPQIVHVEINCSISASAFGAKEKEDLTRKFYDLNVREKINDYIIAFLGDAYAYEKVLITTNDVVLHDVKIIQFETVLSDVVSALDRQNYRSPVIRTMQLMKYLLINKPASMSDMIGREEVTITNTSREKLVKAIITQSSSIRIFKKKGNEDLLIHLLKNSSLKNPEKLAKALDEVFTERSANRFLNVLLKQKNMKLAIKEEIMKDTTLADFLEQ